MLCIEVWVNGQRQCTAGVEEFGRLTASLHWMNWSEKHWNAILADCDEEEEDGGEIFNPELRVYGGTGIEPYQHMNWLERAVAMGDEITLKIVEAESPDAPEIHEYED